MRLMASEVAQAAGGRLVGPDVEVSGASFDSRTVAQGQLFVPVVSERDGHDFIDDALAAGAVAYLTVRSPQGASAVVVDDTAAALADLGLHARSKFDGPLVGITGSVGKTSVKDMTAAAIGADRPTHASPMSFNNELGVPITLVNRPDDAEAVVVEMGARGTGHIARLCTLAQPTVGVVTSVGAAHTELFGTVEAVAEAKGELVEALDSAGVAVLNADQPLVAAMAGRTEADVLTFGRSNGDVRASGVSLDDGLCPRFRLETPVGPGRCGLGGMWRTHGGQRVGRGNSRIGRRGGDGRDRRWLGLGPALSVAHGGDRAGFRGGADQRRLQRQPHVDGCRPALAGRGGPTPPSSRSGGYG